MPCCRCYVRVIEDISLAKPACCGRFSDFFDRDDIISVINHKLYSGKFRYDSGSFPDGVLGLLADENGNIVLPATAR